MALTNFYFTGSWIPSGNPYQVDSADTIPAGPVVPLGTIIEAQDATYGAATLIYLEAADTEVEGNALVYNGDYLATLTDQDSVGNFVVSLAAKVAGEFGWYVKRGQVPVTSTGTITILDKKVYTTTTAGSIGLSGTGNIEIIGARNSSASASGYTTLYFDTPYVSQ